MTTVVSLLNSLGHEGLLTCALCCSSPCSRAFSLCRGQVAHGQCHPDALRLCGTAGQLHRDALWVLRGWRDPGWALAPIAACRQTCHHVLIEMIVGWTADHYDSSSNLRHD